MLMKKISISSSSFILSKHPIWNDLSSNFDLDFKNVGNYSKALLSTSKSDLNVCILFAADLFDENLKPFIPNKEIKEICDPVLNLIKKKAKSCKEPLIICFSYKSVYNLISSAFRKPSSEKIYEYISNNINLLQREFRNIYFLNIDYYFNQIGYQQIFDKRNWYLANCRITLTGLEIIVKNLRKLINRIDSPSKKILILDCDNTLWGGVIGEDGIKSILLGQDGEGRAYLDFQKAINFVSKQGILLAICSKNNENDVMEVFENHKSMQIKKKDIINFKINWEEKSKNIKKISEELDLGLQSFVFWDDNPFERDKVKKNLPEVLTIEPHTDVSYWSDQLREIEGLSKFDITKEDKKKLYQYKIRSKFIKDKEKSTDENNYLKSIKLKAKRLNLDKSNIARAVQMTQKTNQFNLRTIRYTQKQIENLSKNKKNIIFLISLKDIYGDHGIIGLFIGKIFTKDSIFIDTILLSCRVLGRNLETWILKEIKNICKKKKIKDIFSEYIKTDKNILCNQYYKQHNFKEIKRTKNLKFVLSNNKKSKIFQAKLDSINTTQAKVYD